MKTIIIAEAGVNHNGELSIAKKLIEQAAEAGADYVKFQTFVAEKNISKSAPKAEYQNQNYGEEDSQLEMVRKYELTEEDHLELIDHCNLSGITFLSTPFDDDSIELLHRLNVSFFKIPSGEVTNLPFLRHIATCGRPIVLSTGMSTMDEIEKAIEVITTHGVEKSSITVLHCNTDYPTPMEDVNLKAMQTIEQEFNVKVGYSDHTLGIEVPIAAVTLGARVIEKHFTLDRSMTGPDHKASLEPDELKQMVQSIRNIEQALGSGIKTPSASEKKNISIARKSLHVFGGLKEGEVISEKNLIAKRPGNGISPMEIDNIIGKTVSKDLPDDHMLSYSDFN